MPHSPVLAPRLALGAMILGAAVLLGSRGPTHEFGGGWWAESLTAVAEALLIAGVLGVTLDRLLKIILVRDVARLALRAIFGTNAPQEYVNELQARLQEIKLVHLRQSWLITLAWHTPGEILTVTVEADIDSVNVSSTIWEPQGSWITHSAYPDLKSRLSSYRTAVRITARGNRADLINSRHVTSSELDRATKIERDGSARVVWSNLDLPAVPPGAHRHLTITGVTYQPAVGGFPLVVGAPCLGTTVRVEGAALKDLEITLRLGGSGALSNRDSSNADIRLFDHGFTLPGATFRLHWAMKASPVAS